MNGRCIWVVPSSRQHSITRKCKPLSRIWIGYREGMSNKFFYPLRIAYLKKFSDTRIKRACPRLVGQALFLFITDCRNAILYLLLCPATYTHRHFYRTDTYHFIFHNHHSLKRLMILLDRFGNLCIRQKGYTNGA